VSFLGGRARAVIAVAILAVGAITYAFFGTTNVVDGGRMARLVVPTTGIAQFETHPLEATFEPPSKSSVSPMKRAGETQPNETGAYQVTWRAKSSKTIEAGVLVQLLPTVTLARSVQHDLKNDYSEPKKITAAGLDVAHKFTVPGLPGAYGASFVEKSTTSSSVSTNLYVVLFQVNRVGAFVLLQSTSTAIGQQEVSSLAVSEARLLRDREPGFSLTHTVRPASRALWFGLGTLAAIAAILLLPVISGLVARRRENKEERNRVRAQRHVLSRGSKVMQRQRVPEWQRRPAKK
jgi:hypothetical protein